MRIPVFIDYWNFQITRNQKLAKSHGVTNYKSQIAWGKVGPVLAREACQILGSAPASLSYEGTYIYTSYNPATPEERKYKNWVTSWLDKQPGINVQIRERRPKSAPKCTTCHREITNCPHSDCGRPINATLEKGVDTLLVTDLIRMGVRGAYDAAVIVSLDADLIPGVQFVQSEGKKVIQAGFPPSGTNLATECWGSFDIMKVEKEIQEPRRAR